MRSRVFACFVFRSRPPRRVLVRVRVCVRVIFGMGVGAHLVGKLGSILSTDQIAHTIN
jgi:hypothetical protein